MKRHRPIAAAVLTFGAFIPAGLAGCTASANLTVPPSTIEEKAADALQAQVGTDYKPSLDCGSKDIDLVDGTVVDCVLTDPVTSSTFDTKVTISDVQGTTYHLDVKVADSPH